jgi:hypothetical protein
VGARSGIVVATAEPEAKPASSPSRHRWRRAIAWVLLVLGAIAVPLSVVAIWTRNQVLNTDRYVSTMAPLARNSDVQAAAANRVTSALLAKVDVEEAAKEALPKRAQFLAGPIQGAVRSFVHEAAFRFVSSDQFARLWDGVNRVSHQQVRAVLTGEGPQSIQTKHGEVTIDLAVVAGRVKDRLVQRGLTVLNKVDTSKIDAKIVIFDSKSIEQAQRGTRALKALAIALPIFALLCFAGAVWLARDHRRALIRVGFAIAISAAVLSVGIALGRAQYLNALSGVVQSKDAAAAVYDIVLRNVRTANRVFIVIGLLLATGAALAGPSRPAVAIRSLFTGGAAKAGSHVSTNPVTRWVAREVVLVRSLVVAAVVLILVFWDQPRPLTVLVLAVVLVILLVVVEILARAGAAGAGEPSAAGEASTGESVGAPTPSS